MIVETERNRAIYRMIIASKSEKPAGIDDTYRMGCCADSILFSVHGYSFSSHLRRNCGNNM